MCGSGKNSRNVVRTKFLQLEFMVTGTNNVTVEEATVYLHIGYKKLRSMIKEYPGAKWILYSGNRIMIKREQFEKWLDNQSAI